MNRYRFGTCKLCRSSKHICIIKIFWDYSKLLSSRRSFSYPWTANKRCDRSMKANIADFTRGSILLPASAFPIYWGSTADHLFRVIEADSILPGCGASNVWHAFSKSRSGQSLHLVWSCALDNTDWSEDLPTYDKMANRRVMRNGPSEGFHAASRHYQLAGRLKSSRIWCEREQ